MTKTFVAAAIAALGLAAPAGAIGFPPVPEGQALYPETVTLSEAHATAVHLVTGRGFTGRTGFTLSTKRVTYDGFRSTSVESVVFGRNAVKLHGFGLAGGRRVPFTAIGVHNATAGVDVFRIAWNHGASLGGRVTSGLVFIR